MDTLLKADIFFFITSIAVVVVLIIFVFMGFYLVQTLRNIRDISNKLKRAADLVEGDFETAYDQMKDMWPLKFFFRKKKKTRSKTE